ncbi:hypothetical protein FQN57_002836 [Myotisia sp. PD_48]|nr:hypothetical protein FQN57_002836 [Myotisia sp. PD_48]
MLGRRGNAQPSLWNRYGVPPGLPMRTSTMRGTYPYSNNPGPGFYSGEHLVLRQPSTAVARNAHAIVSPSQMYQGCPEHGPLNYSHQGHLYRANTGVPICGHVQSYERPRNPYSSGRPYYQADRAALVRQPRLRLPMIEPPRYRHRSSRQRDLFDSDDEGFLCTRRRRRSFGSRVSDAPWDLDSSSDDDEPYFDISPFTDSRSRRRRRRRRAQLAGFDFSSDDDDFSIDERRRRDRETFPENGWFNVD